jgi:hypothetical protein
MYDEVNQILLNDLEKSSDFERIKNNDKSQVN